MPKTILVTGGAGFVGSHLCDALVARGDSVICVDNFNDYYDPSIKEHNIHPLSARGNFRLCRTDITDAAALKETFDEHKPDAVIHTAARAGVRPSIESPFLYTKTNIEGTINILELSKKSNIRKFIFASSSSVYGLGKVPFREDSNTLDPISPYAATKISGELLCRAYHHLCHIPMVCLRLFTVYGPRGRPDMAPYKFMKSILEGEDIQVYGDGTSQRDYTYVGDIVNGFIAAMDKNLTFETINLGNSHPIPLKALIQTIEKHTGKKAKIRHLPNQPGDVPVTYADVSKAKRLLEWKPKTDLDAGVKQMVDWYTFREASKHL